MKLRNKKTGKRGWIACWDNNYVVIYPVNEKWEAYNDEKYVYHSLSEVCDDWEDYEPVEPLIKDEKILKAVRAWAEVNELEPDFEVRYSENTFSLISWQACIEFNTQIDGLEHGKKYTITELCGEETE